MSTSTTQSCGTWMMLEDWKQVKDITITFSNGDPIASGPEPNGDPIASGPEPNGDPMASGPEPNGDPMASGPEPNGDPMASGPEPNGDPIASGPEPNEEPVRIISRGVEEIIHYSEQRMEYGKLYPIEWYGEKFVLVKRDNKITMLAEDEV